MLLRISRATSGGLALGLFLAACGGSSSGDEPMSPVGGGSGGGGSGGSAGTSASGGGSGSGAVDGGSGGTSSAPVSGMQVLHEGEDDASSVALDERFVYWSSQAGLRQAPLEGGAPITLATGSYIRAIAPSREYVYFTQHSFGMGRVARVARGGGEVLVISEGVAPQEIVVAGDHVYWVDPGISIDTGQAFRANVDGTDVTQLAGGLAQPSGNALDAEFVYFGSSGQSCTFTSDGGYCIGGGIHRVSQLGGTPEEVVASNVTPSIVFGPGGIFWFEGAPPYLMQAEPFGTARQVLNVLAEGTGPLTTDGAALYWSSEDKVLRMPFDGEVVTRLATNLEYPSGVAVRGDWAYFAEPASGRILRVATDGSANRPGGPITGPCPDPIGSADELGLTPRADVNLEQLALSLEPGNVTASQAVYDRVLTDVAAIRALVPDRADIGYRAPHDGKTLYLGLSDVAAQSIGAGEYSAWDCLNEPYGASVGELNEGLGGNWSLLITLRGIYDVSRIAERYAELPGVTTAEANFALGDGSSLCAAREGERYQYVVDRAGGDCPAGCTEHDMLGFESDAAGQISALGAWTTGSGAAPAWATICR
ncbi:MAG TPA: hypothetical protein VMG12_45375 [Polyangiaceae bacterium]|nr:hypothetical protein [Polyangiaceae bacterium]